MGVYRQIRAQEVPVLQDVNEDNFDHAFSLLRPVLRGEADVSGEKLTEDEVQKAMHFCTAIFAPTTPTMHADVAKRLPEHLLNMKSPVLLAEDISRVVSVGDENAYHVLSEINARKPIHAVYDVGNHFVQEAFGGFAPGIKQGELGLYKVD